MTDNSSLPSKPALVATGLYAAVWLVLTADWFFTDQFADLLRLIGCGLGCVVSGAWLAWAWDRARLTRAIVGTVAFVPAWQFALLFADLLAWEDLRVALAQCGLGGLFLVGLAWVIWGLERASRRYELERYDAARQPLPPPASAKRIWNPLDAAAWYYLGPKSRKLNQSLAAFASYCVMFLVCFLLLTQTRGCQELYEMPAGGGQQKTIAQTVKIEIKKRIKYVINPFSSIIFNPPPIDEVRLQLTEATSHMYAVGYGEGDGAGFAGGTKRGKVRFIRIEYTGGDWNQDFGVGSDLNMLNEYGIRTKQKINSETESRTIGQLRNFPIGKSPPFMYLTGQGSISISDSERKILREYLLDKHGMIFCDNGGSRHFHNQFVDLMNRVLDHKVEPVPVPLDDVIHSVPYKIPFLPYVAPHGGKEALGWKVDGRWVAYYSPGDIGDAWSDDHAGVNREITEYCYQLGTNVIFYAHLEYNKWLDARQSRK